MALHSVPLGQRHSTRSADCQQHWQQQRTVTDLASESPGLMFVTRSLISNGTVPLRRQGPDAGRSQSLSAGRLTPRTLQNRRGLTCCTGFHVQQYPALGLRVHFSRRAGGRVGPPGITRVGWRWGAEQPHLNLISRFTDMISFLQSVRPSRSTTVTTTRPRHRDRCLRK